MRIILEPIGEPATLPRIASARGPPVFQEDFGEVAVTAEACLLGDPLAQPEPWFEYDPDVRVVAARCGAA